MTAAQTLPDTARRDQVIAQISPGYRGELHFLGLLQETGAVMGGAAWMLSGVQWWELLVVPVSLAFANAVEWYIHRGPLHHPVPPRILYKRHTLMHHAAFTFEDMSVHAWRELRLILFPLYALPLLLLLVVPVAWGLMALGQPNMAWLFVLAAALYYLSYELLHLAYHLPHGNPVGRLPIIQRLARHHRTHHDPPLMLKGNFNVSIPFWDWLMGTIIRDPRHER